MDLHHQSAPLRKQKYGMILIIKLAIASWYYPNRYTHRTYIVESIVWHRLELVGIACQCVCVCTWHCATGGRIVLSCLVLTLCSWPWGECVMRSNWRARAFILLHFIRKCKYRCCVCVRVRCPQLRDGCRQRSTYSERRSIEWEISREWILDRNGNVLELTHCSPVGRSFVRMTISVIVFVAVNRNVILYWKIGDNVLCSQWLDQFWYFTAVHIESNRSDWMRFAQWFHVINRI